MDSKDSFPNYTSSAHAGVTARRNWGRSNYLKDYETTRYGSDSEQSSYHSNHKGKGPKSYRPSDDRINEEICEALLMSDEVDATEIEVLVKDGHVILLGLVDDKWAKYMAEDIAEKVYGVIDVDNKIRAPKSDLLNRYDLPDGA